MGCGSSLDGLSRIDGWGADRALNVGKAHQLESVVLKIIGTYAPPRRSSFGAAMTKPKRSYIETALRPEFTISGPIAIDRDPNGDVIQVASAFHDVSVSYRRATRERSGGEGGRIAHSS